MGVVGRSVGDGQVSIATSIRSRTSSSAGPVPRSAVAIASNEPFSSWTKTFTDPRLCAAIVDRLTFAGQIIETGTSSYRLAHARKRRNTAER